MSRVAWSARGARAWIAAALLAIPAASPAAELGVGDFDLSPWDIAAPLDLRRVPLAAPPSAAPAVDGRYEVDVLVLYTPLYRRRVGAVRPEAQRLIAIANGFNDNSLIPVRYRLVGVEPYRGTSEDAGFYDNRDRIASDARVRELRDRSGADLVTLLRTMDGNADLCGLASGFNGAQRGGDPPENVDPERDAFSVSGMGENANGQRCADYVFAHELAHDLGAGHALAASPGLYYWKPYAHGTLCLDQATGATYQSIMAGFGQNLVNINGVRVATPTGAYFSNPDLIAAGQLCGAEAPLDSDAGADNARVMREAAPYVAAYRQPAKSGTGGGVIAGAGSGATLALLGLTAIGARRRRCSLLRRATA